MPQCNVVFYAEKDGSSPVLIWFYHLPQKIQDKLAVRMELLAERGYDLHRPEADYLKDGIYELRVRYKSVNYRILYFFYQKISLTAILTHGIIKEDIIPVKDINIAVHRKLSFELDPEKHTYER